MARRRSRRHAQQRRRRGVQRRQRARPAHPLNYQSTFLHCQSGFLTPTLWKAAHGAARPFRAARWQLVPLVMVGMLMVLLTAQTIQERFEQARELWARLRPGRRRPGRTVRGFRQALGRLPRRVFKAMAPVLRDRVAAVLEPLWWVGGWVPFGVDGSRLSLARTASLERRFGRGSNAGSGPQLWLTTLVHLASGALWSWQVGRAKASERRHAQALMHTLPERSVLVADAGFVGYALWRALAEAGHAFLIRLRSGIYLYADFEVSPDFAEGMVYLWPKTRPRRKPLALRLIRLPGRRGESDVWLATNVLDSTRLSRKTASTLFRMRWEHELFFRAYKCTLQQAKLWSRSVHQVIREMEVALLTTQVFLAQAAWAVWRRGGGRGVSVAEGLRQIRRELRDVLKRGLRAGYLKRLGEAAREDRPGRTSSKTHRQWPQKKRHRPPGPPEIIRLSTSLKRQLEKDLCVA